MTTARYLAYKRVLGIVEEMHGGPFDDEERAMFRDMAEGLLLTRYPEAGEHDRILDRASMLLSVMLGARRLTAAESERLWSGLAACGPPRLAIGSQPGPSLASV